MRDGREDNTSGNVFVVCSWGGECCGMCPWKYEWERKIEGERERGREREIGREREVK